ncbi:MAG: HTTM domain-containing protein [Crocinitomicaceae bacterium]|nr:HTTM domain-containing protein [Crocinitomicaceae bacterium]
MTVIDSITSRITSLNKNTSIAPLVIFRIIFGALMLFGISRFLYKGWVQQLYIDPQYHFGYYGFEWVKPLEGELMYLPFILMIIASVFIIAGFLYRYSAFAFFICFTYVELLDKSNYLNHYYFVSLMSFLMTLVPANRYFSIDTKLWPQIKRTVTLQWHTGILKFQLAVVYIFAGIAKINSDWLLDAQPLRTWLQAHHNIPIVGGLFQEEWMAYVFSWFGCGYDLLIVFFLLSNKYRKYAYAFVVIFHLLTWYLFPIGVFPWVMIFSTLIFFSIEFHERILNDLLKMFKRPSFRFDSTVSIRKRKVTVYFVSIYVAIQLLVPIRFMLYPRDLFWNEEGFRFSWRVMLMHKEGHATFYLVDSETGRESEINNSKFLTRTQEDQMATQPDMILQYAKILEEYYNGRTLHYGGHIFEIKNPEIHAEIYVSLNGRRSQLFVDKKRDLTLLPYNLEHRNWIEPLKE